MSSPWKRNYSRYKRFFLVNIAQYQKKPTIKAYSEIILSLATIIMFAIFALRPTLLTIAGLIKEIEAKEKTIVVMDGKIENLAKAQALYYQETENIQLLYSAIPEKPSPDVFIRQIEGTSQKHSTRPSFLSIGKVTLLGESKKEASKDKPDSPSSEAEKISASINVAADYFVLTNFLSSLEHLRRPFELGSLDLKTGKSEKGQTLMLSVKGRVPFLKKSF